MKDRKTGLEFRTLRAVDRYITEALIKNNSKYSWSKALRDVGYSESTIKTHSSKMYNCCGVQKKIADWRSRQEDKLEVTLDKIQRGFEEVKELARKAGDLPTMCRCLEGQGKTIGVFKDVIDTTDLTQRDEIDAEVTKEAEEIAKIRLTKTA